VGTVHEAIGGRLRAFVERQPVFFVATAPLDGGHVNVSPKGVGGTLVVVDEHTVAYLDVTASGVETIAHLREPGNGRITLMFCSFDRTPNVVRLHGRGRVRPCPFHPGPSHPGPGGRGGRRPGGSRGRLRPAG